MASPEKGPKVPDDLENEYIDYELFTSADFSAIDFCNSLVQGTNNISDEQIDLDAATVRVKFDLEEVEKLVHREAVENHSDLIAHASKLNVAEKVLDTTKESLTGVTNSFQRLENEVLKPYNTALPIYRSLTKLHATSNLLRSLTWYLYLVRQYVAQTVSAEPKSAARANKTFSEIARHIGNYPRLKNLKVVSELELAIRRRDPMLFPPRAERPARAQAGP
ncbi:Golgi transport complex subunit 5-domain-containing protein [Dipodascopsis tothii]|uniref:Golgi transport complex subunit 5-domain-containing protein n=1 Tax=Dipodascopsis tothii TaxID=44089 RepID=UPI0034CE46DE